MRSRAVRSVSRSVVAGSNSAVASSRASLMAASSRVLRSRVRHRVSRVSRRVGPVTVLRRSHSSPSQRQGSDWPWPHIDGNGALYAHVEAHIGGAPTCADIP